MNKEDKAKILNFMKTIDKFYILPIFFILFIVAFIMDKFVIYFGLENFLGLMIGLIFILMVFEDVVKGLLTGGVHSEVKELIVGLIVALIAWYGISFLLNTSTPISAVVTCSMRSNLERGDMVLVQGSDINVYDTIYLGDYDINKIGPKATVKVGNYTQEIMGSVDYYCGMLQDFDNDPICYAYTRTPDKVIESHGALEFHYGICERQKSGNEKYQVPCVVSVKKVNSTDEIQLYPHDDSGDIVVYKPNGGDLFSHIGDIVHRGVVKIKTTDNIYYLTKGDNNQVTDIQVYYEKYGGNHLIPEENIKGKVLLSVPIIGYVKLFMSAQLDMPDQCNYVFNEDAYSLYN